MHKAKVIVGALTLASGTLIGVNAYAAQCPNGNSTFSVLVGFGTAGCDDEDKNWSNFGTNAINPFPDSVVNISTVTVGNDDQHRFQRTGLDGGGFGTGSYYMEYSIGVIQPSDLLITQLNSGIDLSSGHAKVTSDVYGVVGGAKGAFIAQLVSDTGNPQPQIYSFLANGNSENAYWVESLLVVDANSLVNSYTATWIEAGAPEPATLGLLGLGFAGLGATARRRKAKAA